MRSGSQVWLSSHLFPMEQLSRGRFTDSTRSTMHKGWGQVGEVRMDKEGQQEDWVPPTPSLYSMLARGKPNSRLSLNHLPSASNYLI